MRGQENQERERLTQGTRGLADWVRATQRGLKKGWAHVRGKGLHGVEIQGVVGGESR